MAKRRQDGAGPGGGEPDSRREGSPEPGPAERAGIQPGDAILSYAGERVYDAGSLVNATREGTAGATTAVEIEREGSTQLVYVPRGPLGINIRVARIRPSD